MNAGKALSIIKYILIFSFVIWAWEGVGEQNRPVLFWATWVFAMGYGIYLSIRYYVVWKRQSLRMKANILFLTGYVFCLAAVAALWFSDYDGMQSLAFYLTFSLGFGYSALIGFRLNKIDSK